MLQAERRRTDRPRAGRWRLESEDPRGHDPTGDEPIGHDPTGNEPIGHDLTGNEPIGHEQIGHKPVTALGHISPHAQPTPYPAIQRAFFAPERKLEFLSGIYFGAMSSYS